MRDHTIHFHQLDRKTGARVEYRKVSSKSGRKLDADDIEKGYEITKGKYVVVDESEFEELRPRSTHTIDVTDFVELAAIDPIYYANTYWLGTDGEGAARAYRLLFEAMEKKQQVAIGTVVMRNKQYLAAIRPLDGALAMSTMRFADEVVPRAEIDDIPSARVEPTDRELRSGDADDRLADDRLGPGALRRHVHRRAPRADRGQGEGQGRHRRAGHRAGSQGARSDGGPQGQRRAAPQPCQSKPDGTQADVGPQALDGQARARQADHEERRIEASLRVSQPGTGGQVRATVGTVTVIDARFICFVSPERIAQASSAPIHGGSPGGRSHAGIAARSASVIVSP